MTKRKYVGSIIVEKLYVGEKTINLIIGRTEGERLVNCIREANAQCKLLDLKIVRKPRANQKYNLTVTYPLNGDQN